MLEETSPRTSAKWIPHSTFAADMGLAGDEKAKSGKGEVVQTEQVVNEKSMV